MHSHSPGSVALHGRLTCHLHPRGPRGRFVFADTAQQQAIESQSKSTTPKTFPGSATRRCCASKTAEQAEISVDLTNLGEAELAVSPGTSPSSCRPVESAPDHGCYGDQNRSHGSPPGPKASYFGESWYASFLLQNTNREPHQLHRPIDHQSSVVRTSSGGRDRPGLKDQGNILLDGALSKQHVDSLLDTYFARFHVMVPILSQHSFLASVRDQTVSITLLLSVLYVASTHCESEMVHQMGYKTRIDAGDDLFHRAKASFETDTISDRVTMIQCSFLLHYWWGRPTNFRDSLWWLATAIRSAQCMGMHRSTSRSKMPEGSKQKWRRIWWCLYVSCFLYVVV